MELSLGTVTGQFTVALCSTNIRTFQSPKWNSTLGKSQTLCHCVMYCKYDNLPKGKWNKLYVITVFLTKILKVLINQTHKDVPT